MRRLSLIAAAIVALAVAGCNPPAADERDDDPILDIANPANPLSPWSPLNPANPLGLYR